jgi:transposase InsO family protein
MWTKGSQSKRLSTCGKQRPLQDTRIEVAVQQEGGQGAEVAGVGTVSIRTEVNGRTEIIDMKDVLHVPKLVTNLFSVVKAVDAGAVIIMSKQKKVLKMTGRIVLQCSESDGLKYIDTVRERAHRAGVQTTAKRWHQRYGHLGYQNLQRLRNSNMVTGINTLAREFEKQSREICEQCVLSKQHKIPHPPTGHQTSSPLEVVHTDLCGPMPEKTSSGARYFLTLYDDFSKVSMTQDLNTKADAAEELQKSLLYLERQSGFKVQAVRSDRGGEFVNKRLGDFFKDTGIEHQLSAAYTPQQNGSAERLNRVLEERARAMLLDSGLPDHLWAEAIATASYLRNRSPVSDKSKTPLETFLGKKPDVKHLRVFGASAFVLKHSAHKFDARSVKGHLVGYERAAFRVWMPETNKIEVSCNVTFNEAERYAKRVEKEPDFEEELASETSSSGTLTMPHQEEEGSQQEVQDEAQDENNDDSDILRRSDRQRNPPRDWWIAGTGQRARAAQTVTEPTTLQEAMCCSTQCSLKTLRIGRLH